MSVGRGRIDCCGLSVSLQKSNISLLRLCLVQMNENQDETVHSQYEKDLWHRESSPPPKPASSSADFLGDSKTVHV